MSRRVDTAAGDQRALVSVLPAAHTARIGGVDLSAVERQLIEDFRGMGNAGRTLMPRLFAKQASRDREKRIAQNKPKFQLVQEGVQ
ncbi:hypothetical protein ACEN9F_30460 [Duganella sp. CT11-25]|uniref:hypothetical protein n=1 Tax=unclassified Duganella TaxID=2636909 RepID=UPI0039AEFB1B